MRLHWLMTGSKSDVPTSAIYQCGTRESFGDSVLVRPGRFPHHERQDPARPLFLAVTNPHRDPISPGWTPKPAALGAQPRNCTMRSLSLVMAVLPRQRRTFFRIGMTVPMLTGPDRAALLAFFVWPASQMGNDVGSGVLFFFETQGFWGLPTSFAQVQILIGFLALVVRCCRGRDRPRSVGLAGPANWRRPSPPTELLSGGIHACRSRNPRSLSVALWPVESIILPRLARPIRAHAGSP